MSRAKNYNNKIEVPVVTFSVNQGGLKVLLLKNEAEPYKGYWKLPAELLEANQDISQFPFTILKNQIGLNNAVINQANVYFSPSTILNEEVIHISYMAMANTVDAIYNREEIDAYETEWFDTDKLPKIGYHHEQVIKDALEILKTKLSVTENIQILLPSDFTLPEIQRVYEQVLNKKLDRRNFRKKIIEFLEDTGEKYASKNGRPAKLYRFKETTRSIYS